MATYARQILAELGTAKTGLAGTLGVAVIDIDGTTRLARTTVGIGEQGASGVYYKSVTWDTAWGDCRAVWTDHPSSPTFTAVGEEPRRPLVDDAGAVTSASTGPTTAKIELNDDKVEII